MSAIEGLEVCGACKTISEIDSWWQVTDRVSVYRPRDGRMADVVLEVCPSCQSVRARCVAKHSHVAADNP